MSIVATGISKRFGDFTALDDVSLEVEPGSLTALLGPERQRQVDAAARDRGARAARLRARSSSPARTRPRRAPQNRGVGFVFQHYAAFKHMTVRDNVAFGLTIRKRPKDEIKARVDELLELVQLQPFAHRYPGAALRRPAAADGARARARGRAEGAPPRRAVRRARRPRPRRAARLAPPAPRRGARDHRLRHARPGGGDGGRRPDRRHEQGPDRAGRRPARPLRAAGDRVRDELHRPDDAHRRRLGAPARPRAPARAGGGHDRGDDRARRPPRLRGPGRARRAPTRRRSGPS